MANKILGRVPVNRGAYDSTAIYYKDNLVQFNGSTYICTEDNVANNSPASSNKWKVFAASGASDTGDISELKSLLYGNICKLTLKASKTVVSKASSEGITLTWTFTVNGNAIKPDTINIINTATNEPIYQNVARTSTLVSVPNNASFKAEATYKGITFTSNVVAVNAVWPTYIGPASLDRNNMTAIAIPSLKIASATNGASGTFSIQEMGQGQRLWVCLPTPSVLRKIGDPNNPVNETAIAGNITIQNVAPTVGSSVTYNCYYSNPLNAGSFDIVLS